jgi:hypothetical protein
MESQQGAGKRLLDNDTDASKKRRKVSKAADEPAEYRGSGSAKVSSSTLWQSLCKSVSSMNPFKRRSALEFYPLPALNVQSPYHRIVYIMRGLPCSGKSFAARTMWTQHLKLGGLAPQARDGSVPESIKRAFVFSTDDYFTYLDASGNEEYQFDFKKIGSYHEKNQRRCEVAMELGITAFC